MSDGYCGDCLVRLVFKTVLTPDGKVPVMKCPICGKGHVIP